MSTILSFKSIQNKHDIFRDKDCMKKFGECLREHAMKIIKKKWSYNNRAAGATQNIVCILFQNSKADFNFG